jgi:hypothetical protein
MAAGTAAIRALRKAQRSFPNGTKANMLLRLMAT